MKLYWRKCLSLILCVAMTIPFVACGETADTPSNETNPTGDSQANSGTLTEIVTENKPYVEKNDYGEEFVVTYCSDIFQKGYFFVDPDNRNEGNDLDDNLYEREILVEEYLGVEIIPIDGGSYKTYAEGLKNNVSAGDDEYQMVMTHTYTDIANLITGNFLYDMNNLSDSLNLDAPYWNLSLMEDLSVNDAMYLGYNDFCLSQCYLVAYNKTMYEPYAPTTGNLYEMVDDMEWTLDRMLSIAALIDEEGDASVKNYGMATFAWVPLISFVTASGIKFVDRDADGELYVTTQGNSNEKFIDLHEKLYDMCQANYSYCWGPDGGTVYPGISAGQMDFADERALMTLTSNYGLIFFKGEDIEFGVLPYPMYEANQAGGYQSLSWNGVLGVASSIRNPQMVGDVMEMLAYYTTDVKVSFYETLLGAKVANAPDDARMLDVIWDSVVSDIGLIFSSSSNQMYELIYAIPHQISVYNDREIASCLKTNSRTAQKNLRNMFT